MGKVHEFDGDPVGFPMPVPSRRLLLDVNVWIALLDDDHVHNVQASVLIRQPGLAIASCPLTENGVLRILNMPSYGRGAKAGFSVIRQKMQLLCEQMDHEFWGDSLSLIRDDVLDFSRLGGHNQITDAYLLALAVRHGGALATFDQRIGLNSVRGATAEHLVLL